MEGKTLELLGYVSFVVCVDTIREILNVLQMIRNGIFLYGKFACAKGTGFIFYLNNPKRWKTTDCLGFGH